MQISTLAKSDHFFRERTNGLRLSEGSFDAFVFDEAADLVREQSVAVR